jgi:hypothetical protein
MGHPAPSARLLKRAVRNKRASPASEIVQWERQLRQRKKSLGHVDATGGVGRAMRLDHAGRSVRRRRLYLDN